MWRYRYSDELYHGDHKYIAKIGSGENARYFYTQEALNAYKQALSSGDERRALEKTTIEGEKKMKDLQEVNQDDDKVIAKAIKNKDLKAAKKELSEMFSMKERERLANEEAAKVKAAEKAYAESKTLKGKAKAVSEVHKEIKAEKDAVKAEKKKQRKQKLDDYKNALSSKDEKVAYDKAFKNERAVVDDLNVIDKTEIKNSNKIIGRGIMTGDMTEAKATIKKNRQKASVKGREQLHKEARAKTDKAQKDYAEAQTVKGKVKDVADTYKKYNPKSAERIQNGKNYLDELFKKKRR